MNIKQQNILLYLAIAGFVLTVTLILFFIEKTPKYSIDVSNKLVLSDNTRMFFSDLNFDGNSENIKCFIKEETSSFRINACDERNNIKWKWKLVEDTFHCINVSFNDYDNDSLKEIFVFTQVNDSLVLYILDKEKRKSLYKKRVLFDVAKTNSTFNVEVIGAYNMNQDENKEILFFVNGIPELSQKIFLYDTETGKLQKSHDLGVKILKPIIVEDLDLDGKLEVYISSRSLPQEKEQEQSLFVGLNNNLEYLFEPIMFPGNASKTTITKYKFKKQNTILALNSNLESENKFTVFNPKGVKLEEKKIKENTYLSIINNDSTGLYLFSGYKILKFNKYLEIQEKHTFKDKNCFIEYVLCADINKDSTKEFLFKKDDGLFILDNDLSGELRFSFKKAKNSYIDLYTNEIDSKLSLTIDNYWFLLKYEKDKTFFSCYMFYFSIFIVIFFFAFLFIYMANKRNKTKRDLLLKTNEEEFYKQLENNIAQKELVIKQQQSVYNTSHTSRILNSRSKPQGGGVIDIYKNIDLKEKISNIIEYYDFFNVNITFFPLNKWRKIESVKEEMLKYILIEQLEVISSCLNKTNSVSIQLVQHANSINVLIELDDILINKNLFEDTYLLEQLNNKKSKIEIVHFKDKSSLISTSVPLVNNEVVNTNRKIRIVLAEDHDVSLFGLMSLFKTKRNIEVVGMAKNGMEVLKILKKQNVDIVITDISMPGMDGIELSEEIKNQYPDIKVIAFTMYLENWFMDQLVNKGVMGYVSKNSKITELICAVKNVYQGEIYYCPQFKSKFGVSIKSQEPNLDSLTIKEQSIVDLFAEDLNKQQIASMLTISENVLESIIANILLKLRAADEDEIKRIAKKQKYITE
ncbi:MAG: response regulator transcription factor [Bacteroidales bacterium]|nr:response regulator transcription factor [Bacteroidales bacterium]